MTRTIASSFLGAALALVFVGLFGFTPDARNNGVLPTGSVSSAEIADGAVALADLADLATDKLLGRVTAGTGVPEAVTFTDFAQSLVDDTSAATARATLGLTDPSNHEQYAVLASDQAESAASYADATGVAFTPEASSTYIVEFFGTFTSTAATTALQWKFVGPTGTDWSASYLTAPTTSTATGFVNGAIGTANEQTATAATTGVPLFGFAIFRTDASPSGDLKIQFRAEVAGGQSVTLRQGSFIRYRKLQ